MLWAILDYIDDSGRNVIKHWMEGLPATSGTKVKAKLNARLQYLGNTERTNWGPYVSPLTGAQWEGVYEIRMRVAKVQYRPLFAFGPGDRSFTLLMGAEERGGAIEPASAHRTCQERRRRLQEGGRTIPHDYS